MASMSLDKQMQQYWALLDAGKKRTILAKIRSLLAAGDTSKEMTREEFIVQYNKELDDAEKRIASGDYIDQEDLEKESESWQYED